MVELIEGGSSIIVDPERSIIISDAKEDDVCEHAVGLLSFVLLLRGGGATQSYLRVLSTDDKETCITKKGL